MSNNLIENNELASLRNHNSNACFSDDAYENFLGIGSTTTDKAASIKKIVQSKLPAIPKTATCEWLSVQLDNVQAEMNATRGKVAGGENAKLYAPALSILEDKIAEIKKKQNALSCQAKKDALETKTANEETIATLKQATASATTSKSNTIKYISYGLGGLIVITGIIVLMRKK